MTTKLRANRVRRTYLGGGRIDAFTGFAPDCSDGVPRPEDWLASTTTAFNGTREIAGEGLGRLEDGRLVKDAVGKLPILVKLLDSDERLVVQAHPTVPCARAKFNSPVGKTECWYFLDGTAPDACVYLGFKPGVTRTAWRAAFEAQRGILDMLHRVPVRAGDFVFVDGGVPHAIGGGCFMVEINGIVRIRLGSLEPRIITEEFVQGLVRVTKLCPHFHLSLQSACNETLKRMNRKYTIEEYMDSCDRLRKVYDRPAITTDVIVGFPGETEEEFQMTYENLKRLDLYEMHVFKYSKRRGTVAEKLPDQIPEQIKNQRSDRLLELTAGQKRAYEEDFRGEKLQVLIEEKMETLENDTSDWYVGHTERYMKVMVPSKTDIRNQITEIIW